MEWKELRPWQRPRIGGKASTDSKEKKKEREKTWGQGKPQPQQEELQANKELNKMMMEKQRMNGGEQMFLY
jgi:hypothetical protein